MALAHEQIQSVLDQLDKFGDDDSAFDTWMSTISNQVRAHGDVGKFRTEAKGLWLARNKIAIRKMIWDMFSNPTTEERHAQEHGSRVTAAAFLDFCKKLGLYCGDTLTVHSEFGEIIPIPINFEGLPHRTPPEAKKAMAASKKAAKKSLNIGPPPGAVTMAAKVKPSAAPKKPRKSRAKAKKPKPPEDS
jgi:hypothetical protein